MQVREIDPNDDDELAAWCAVQRASKRADWPDDPPSTFRQMRAIANGGFGGKRFILQVVDDDAGRTVGCSMQGRPTRDNQRRIELEVHVDPEHRRRGAGRALVFHVEETAGDDGRTVVMAPAEEPLEGVSPGRAFAVALGYECALPELRRDLALPVGAGRLDELEAAARPYTDGYRIVTWRDGCPDDFVAGMIELERTIARDAPHGDLDFEAPTWDEARLRAGEATVADMGLVTYNAGAVFVSNGQLVAVTNVGISGETPQAAEQFATTVAHGHRGHRLGLLVKIANVRAIMEHSPPTRKIMTWNAETNLHMSRVNDELGYVATARGIIWQKYLPGHPPETAVP
jgi:GNAT superfamily N-acetyltransferase